MNYIVFDLEWNQCSEGSRRMRGFLLKLLEIGAVKLNENREMTDQYHVLIQPGCTGSFTTGQRRLSGWI